MKRIFFIISFLPFTGFSQTSGSSTVNDFGGATQRILVINGFDASATDYRKNKKELFAQLADSLKQLVYQQIEPTFKQGAIVYPDTIAATGNPDSVIAVLMAENNASMAIVINKLDAYFSNAGSESTLDKSEKSVKVFYDICSVVTYSLYNKEGKLKESKISYCEFYSERSSLSSFITIGPDIVAKKKDAFKIIAKNAEKLFRLPDLPVSQEHISDISIIKNRREGDTILKYSLSFADLSQIAYDGSSLKNRLNPSFIEAGDVSYYRGNYFNSLMRYYNEFGAPNPDHVREIGFHNIIKTDTNLDENVYTYMRIKSRTFSTLAMLYQTRGKFIKAEKLFNQAMEMRQSWFGKNSPEYYNSLHNLAVLKKDMGLYDEADSLFNYLQPVFKEYYTDNSIQYVTILNNKAMLLAELGRTKEAIQLLNEALKNGTNVLHPAYIDHERILTNRALLEQESGDLVNAEKDYLEAIQNFENKKFDDHPDYNNVLLYYASLRAQKNDPGILDFLSKVTDKIQRRYGKNHPMTARAQSNTGDYYLNRKSYEQAKEVFTRVAVSQLKALGEKHKDYLNTLMKLGVCEWSLHNEVKANEHFTQAINNYMIVVNSLFRTMSEAEKTSFWRTLKPNIDTYMAFAVQRSQTNPSVLKEAYELQLRTKGILINSTRKTKNYILASGDSTTSRYYVDWLNFKTSLAAYYSSPLEDLKEDNVNLEKLEQQANELEKELSRRSVQFNSAYLPDSISFDDIKAKLKKDELAIEIIRIFHYYGEKQGQAEYIGLLANKDSTNPILIQLGGGTHFEQDGLSQYLKFIKDKVTDTSSYNLYWRPLETAVGHYKTLYVSVDGIYNSINLNTLRRSDGTYLIDHYDFILISNTRSVAIGIPTNVSLRTGGSQVLLLGFPNYGNDDIIPPLPETKEEIIQIDTLLIRENVKAKVLIEQDASEENIKSADHPAVLHVATHGFFKPNVDLSKTMNMGVLVSRARENALLRSGLLFNGAESVFKQEPVLDASNNGILYAYEAMNLDLQGTGLVVLSACETGLGEILNGEGVYGLSRSFQVAGAEKILMSLWKVDDRATRELMITYYENWLRLNDPQQAFQQAQKTIKEKYPQPFYWGGFVLLN